LSKTIVLHLGHFVQRPSGISRFLGFDGSFGFLMKLVPGFEAGGGVTAGSVVSKPRDFLVNEVVAIQKFRVEGWGVGDSAPSRQSMHSQQCSFVILQYYSDSAGNCPDTNVVRPRLSQRPRARAGGGASGENIVHQDNAFAAQTPSFPQNKGVTDVHGPFLAGELGLRPRRRHAFEEASLHGDVDGLAEPRGQPFSLVEFAFALL
jgi:hypothetical protein